jgi:hypothetical protein
VGNFLFEASRSFRSGILRSDQRWIVRSKVSHRGREGKSQIEAFLDVGVLDISTFGFEAPAGEKVRDVSKALDLGRYSLHH